MLLISTVEEGFIESLKTGGEKNTTFYSGQGSERLNDEDFFTT